MALISFDKLLKIISTILNILVMAVNMLQPDSVPSNDETE